MLRSKDGRTEVYTNSGDYLGSVAFFTTRPESGDETSYHWVISTDHQAAFYPGTARDFIEQLKKVETSIAQAWPYNQDAITAVVFLGGLANTWAPVQAACPS